MNWFNTKASWGKWQDILVFDFGNSAYLLQGRKHQETGSTEFKIREAQWTNGVLNQEALKAAGLWSTTTEPKGE